MAKRCQYGVLSVECGRPAVTKRPRRRWVDDGVIWNLCEEHAAFLDRLRANIVKHADLLRKLADR